MRWKIRRFVIVLVAVAATACGGRAPSLDELPEDVTCRSTLIVGDEAESGDTLVGAAVEWRLPPESADVAQLNAWCAAVGPAVAGGWSAGDAPERAAVADTLWLVAWNAHLGAGDLRGLVADLRAGRLTGGREVEHFVLLLQEVYREGEAVPAYDPSLPGGSETRPSPPDGRREDIVRAAESLGLRLVYVPAMRNGPDEDRGNALLSTVPLVNPLAVSLPVARQRRVSVAAHAVGRTSRGSTWRLQVASAHLESQPAWWRNPEAERLEQARALIALLPAADASVAGGDFNTQTRGRDEALVRIMMEAYPDTPRLPEGPTYQKAFGLYRGYLDYLFFRLPPGASASYDRVPDAYGSDHFPMVGFVAFDASPPPQNDGPSER